MVILGLEHGITYADDDEGAFALNDAVAGQIKNATVKGFQMLLRSVLPYVSAYRSMTSAAAFEQGTKFLVGNMLDSVNKKLETSLVRGSIGLGEVTAVTGAGPYVLTIKSNDWTPGVFGGAENMKIEALRGATVNATTRIPAGGAITAGEASISSVSFEDKKITVAASGGLVPAVGDVVFEKGAHSKQMMGLHAILGNQSGSLFGINSASYSLWRANVFTPGTLGTEEVLTFAIIQQAISKGVEKGLKGDVKCLVNPGHWDDLLTEQAAMRMYDSSYKSDSVEQGAKSIKFYSQAGMVEIRPSIYVAEGCAYIIQAEDWARVGSTDITFKRPGQTDQFFRDLTDHAGFELRCYTDQALFCIKPGRQVLITNLKVS